MRQTEFIVNKNHPEGLLSLLMFYLFSLLKKQQEVAMLFSKETTLLTFVDNISPHLQKQFDLQFWHGSQGKEISII